MTNGSKKIRTSRGGVFARHLAGLIATKTRSIYRHGASVREEREHMDRARAKPPTGLRRPTVSDLMAPYHPDPRWRSTGMARPGIAYRAARRNEAKALRAKPWRGAEDR